MIDKIGDIFVLPSGLKMHFAYITLFLSPSFTQALHKQKRNHLSLSSMRTIFWSTYPKITLSYYSGPTAAAAAKSLQWRLTLCETIDGSPPGSAVPGILREEHWSGLPFPSPMHESEKWKWIAQSCPTPSDPMDCSLPGSSFHGICQARVLVWGAIAFSAGPTTNSCISLNSHS